MSCGQRWQLHQYRSFPALEVEDQCAKQVRRTQRETRGAAGSLPSSGPRPFHLAARQVTRGAGKGPGSGRERLAQHEGTQATVFSCFAGRQPLPWWLNLRRRSPVTGFVTTAVFSRSQTELTRKPAQSEVHTRGESGSACAAPSPRWEATEAAALFPSLQKQQFRDLFSSLSV